MTDTPGAASASRLPCGRDPDRLLDQVAEGHAEDRDAHQAGCPHCQATLAEYARLWAPFDELAAAPTPVPVGLMDQSLATIRAQAGPTGWGQVEDPEGSFLVAARVVVAVAGHAARAVPGVRMALSALGELTTLTADPDSPERAGAGLGDGVSAGVSGQSVAVELTVAGEYGQDLHTLAERLRARVVDEVAALTGLQVVEVDVTISDVFEPRSSERH